MAAIVTTQTRKTRHPRRHAFVYLAALAVAALSLPSISSANDQPVRLHLLGAYDKFENTWLIGFAHELTIPRRLRATRLDLTYGAITTSSQTEAFVALGPVWQVPLPSDQFFLHLGFSPTLISGSTFEGGNVGGHMHFTTSATLGTTFGRRNPLALSLRIQHTSNGGLNSTNPGLDMIGINVALDISN